MNITENLTPVNHDSGRAGQAITSIVLHTMVGSTASARNRFFNGNAQVSANYLISLDGSISRCVREADTAWCNGRYSGFGGNLTSISIEHEDNGDYNGPRTPQLYQASAELVADVCRRYGIPCDRAHIRLHKEVIDTSRYPGGTACPDSLDVDGIIAKANAILNPATPVVQQPAVSATGETVLLPSDNTSWRLYPTDKLPVVGNEKARLVPSAFPPGLVYAVLGHPYPNVVTIQTQQFGIGNIWVGSDTNAKITQPAPPPPVAPAIKPAEPTKQPTTAKSTYRRLEKPLSLKANKQPTNVYNLDGGSWSVLNNAVVKQVDKDMPFDAVGIAEHPLGSKYFMTAYSFGDADTTGTPAHNNGVNTVDLSPFETPAPVQATAPVEIPAVTPTVQEPVTVTSATPSTSIEVVATPVAPSTSAVPVTSWKDSYKASPADFKAEQDMVVYDLDDASKPTLNLPKGTKVISLGTFTGPDGKEYDKPKLKSYGTKQDHWYGVPVAELSQDDKDILAALEGITLKDELKQAVKHVGPIRQLRLLVWLENWYEKTFKHKK